MAIVDGTVHAATTSSAHQPHPAPAPITSAAPPAPASATPPANTAPIGRPWMRAPSPWEAVTRAVIVTEELAESALTALESRRMQYTEAHRAAVNRIRHIAPELGRTDLQLRAGLLAADFRFRHGDTTGSAELVEEILAGAERIGHTFIMARSHFLLCDIHHSLGDSPSARIHGIRAVELLPDNAPTGVRIDHLRSLGTAYGPGPDSDRVNAYALDLTNVIGDAERAIGIHNSYAYFAFETNDAHGARLHAGQMLALSERRNIPLVASQLDTVARTMMMFGQHEAALDLLRPLIPRAGDPDRTGGIPDLDPKPYGLPECMLTVAEAHRALGRYATAQQALDVAAQRAEERHLRRFRSRVHLAQAQLFAEIGDWQRAFAEHVAYHNSVGELRSDEREARARIIQASYDQDEKRRDIAAFQDLAMRDALTGLHNRRFLDDALARISAQAASMRRPLSVAIADADLFKRINDTFSHDIGDEVLRTLASLLAGAVGAREILGRLGGEEFLILLPDTDPEEASRRCEAMRRAVAEHDFATLTGDLPVTISIGVVTSYDGRATPTQLLGTADRNLYESKRNGRNRVTVTSC